MSDVKHRPIDVNASANDYVVVQKENNGLGEEHRVLLRNIDLPNRPFGLDLNGHNLDADSRFLSATGWQIQSNGSNSPVFENQSKFTRYGDGGLRIGNIAGVSTTNGKFKDLPLTYDLTNVDGFTLWVYCDGPLMNDTKSSTHGGSIMMAVGDAAFANSSYVNIWGIGGGGLRRGWNNLRVSKKSFDTVGNGGSGAVLTGTGVNWASVKRIQIRHTPTADYTGNSIYMDSFFVGGRLSRGKIPVVITLDDTNEESYAMAKLFNSFGIPVTLFAITEYIDNHATYPGTMTWAQLTELYNAGNAVGVHAGPANAFVVSPELMKKNRQMLIDKGMTREGCHNYLAYPNGTFNQSVIDKAKEYGFLGARTINGLGRNDTVGYEETFGGMTLGANNLTCLENIANGGIADPFKVNAGAPATSALALINVDEAIVRQSAFIGYWHQFSELPQAELMAFAAGLATRMAAGTVECLTYPRFSQLYDGCF
jgi:hypothetical protein